MDIPGSEITEVGTCSTDEKPSLVRAASALTRMLDVVIHGVGGFLVVRNLLDYAARKMFREGVSSHVEGKVVNTEESVTTCAHSCAHHAKLMDTALWSGLHEDVQELVFARLPWPQIYRVGILYKDWNRRLMSCDEKSQWESACVRAQPKLFGLLAPGDIPGSFTVNMFDIASNRWHTFETSPASDPNRSQIEIELMGACDGGLVCFFSKAVQSQFKKTPRLVFVCNPLTRVWKQLPPLYGLVQEKIMVQLIMDRETKHYRVIVVGFNSDSKVENQVHVYHSKTGQWTNADGSSSGEVVYGHYTNNILNLNTIVPAACFYSFADGLLHDIGTNFGNNAHDSDLVEDHLFLLKDMEAAVGFPTHCIVEYKAADGGETWTHLKYYPFNRLPRSPLRIQPGDLRWTTTFFACRNFLLLYASNKLEYHNRREFLFVYEFSGEEWCELPITIPGGNHLFHAQENMCELRLDSCP